MNWEGESSLICPLWSVGMAKGDGPLKLAAVQDSRIGWLLRDIQIERLEIKKLYDLPKILDFTDNILLLPVSQMSMESMKMPWKMHGFPCKILHGVLATFFHAHPWHSMQLHGKTQHGIRGDYVLHFHGKSVTFHGSCWKFHGKSINCHGIFFHGNIIPCHGTESNFHGKNIISMEKILFPWKMYFFPWKIVSGLHQILWWAGIWWNL